MNEDIRERNLCLRREAHPRRAGESVPLLHVAPSHPVPATVRSNKAPKKKRKETHRSSHRRCFVKKGVLRNLAKFTGKHLYQRHFLIKLQACNFIKTESLAKVFSCEFCEISNKTFFTEDLRETAFEHKKRKSKKHRKIKSPTPETSRFHAVNQEDQCKWELSVTMAESANDNFNIFLQEKDLKELVLKTIQVPSNLQEVRRMDEFMAQLLKVKG